MLMILMEIINEIVKFCKRFFGTSHIDTKIDKVYRHFNKEIKNLETNIDSVVNKIYFLNRSCNKLSILDELNKKIELLNNNLNNILDIDLNTKINRISDELQIIENYKNEIDITGDKIVEMFIDLKKVLDEITNQMTLFMGVIESNDFEKINGDIQNFKLVLVSSIKNTLNQRNVISDFNKDLRTIQTYEEKLDNINKKINDKIFISNLKNINDLFK